jgi:HK97 family phage major capsid protein
MFANITEDEARAKGYIKGNKKKNEVFTLLKRVTTPQTIYKKQKLDRDDIIDITDFDVVAWLRSEMRIMLDEEIARAILVGDGRLPADDDKISEDHIRPIVSDDDLYAVKVDLASNDAKSFIRGAIRARKQYKGSGNPVLFTTEDMLTEMLLLEDNMGHFMYTSAQALATVLRVREIITVPAMENTKYLGIIVNLNDYNVGADKGGAVSMFDDFDIDYNQQKYLIETRISGALIKPFSAMIVEIGGKVPTYSEAEAASGDNPKTEGWYEKEGTLYRPTNDTEVVDGKTYYERTMA